MDEGLWLVVVYCSDCAIVTFCTVQLRPTYLLLVYCLFANIGFICAIAIWLGMYAKLVQIGDAYIYAMVSE